MGSIVLLDRDIRNKIAAGEIVESPEAIVKELLENSLDAKSTRIDVELVNGGLDLIRVRDNGKGMSKEDLLLCYKRYSTSKIRNLDDLFRIESYGFRGEALASIAAVSQLEISSKREQDVTGHKVVINSGVLEKIESVSMNSGTEIVVKNLFFNTPVRKNYLKTNASEIRKVVSIVSTYSLVLHNIFFSVMHDNKEIFSSPKNETMLGSIANVFGKEVAKDLVLIDAQKGNFSVYGFVSKPHFSRSSKLHQKFFVNKRYVKKISIISDAINNAFHTLMMVSKYPVVILNIDINASNTDVNVHPQKNEIRIKDEMKLYDAVYETVLTALTHSDNIEEKLNETNSNYVTNTFSPSEGKKNYLVSNFKQNYLVNQSSILETESYNFVKIVGVINKTYIVAEVKLISMQLQKEYYMKNICECWKKIQ